MKYSLLINPKTNNSIALTHAIALVNVLIAQRNSVNLFFYGYAVKAAFNKEEVWENFVKNNVSLNACSTIAEEFINNGEIINDSFHLAGLGQWMELVIDSDSYLEII